MGYLRHFPALLLKRRPLHLTYFVTSRCNARCGFCFYKTNGSSEELSLEEIERIAGGTPRLLWFALSGGEVSLRDDLPDICRVFYRHTKPAFILLSTNGLMPERLAGFTEEIARTCRESVVVVKVSLDAIGEEHDSLRGVKGAFEKALKTVSLLGRLKRYSPNLRLGINTVLLSENITEIGQVIEFVNSLPDVEVHTLSLVRGRAFQEMGIGPDEYRRAMDLLREKSLKQCYGFSGGALKAAQDRLRERFIERVIRGKPLPVSCTAGRLSVVITEDADVFPCEAFHLKLGNLRAENFDLSGVLRTSLTRDILQKLGKCECTHECNLMMNILSTPLCYPLLLKEYLHLKRAWKGDRRVPSTEALSPHECQGVGKEAEQALKSPY